MTLSVVRGWQRTALAVLALFTVSTALGGAARAIGPHPDAPTATRGDARALARLHQANLRAIVMGQLAQDRTVRRAVRHYAVMLVDDHRRSERDVRATASQLNLNLASLTFHRTSRELRLQRAVMARLQGSTGDRFDRAFMHTMVRDQRRVIRRVVSDRRRVSDPRVADLIARSLPVLHRHEREAQRILQSFELRGP